MMEFVLILVLFSVSVNTHESGRVCIQSLMVPRNTVWRARVTDLLMINCTVSREPHCWNNVDVSWCKMNDKNVCRPLYHSNYITTAWRNITESKGLLFLIFWDIALQDSGLYRCEIKSPTSIVSHSINITVTDIHSDNKVVTTENTTAGGPAVTVPVMDETHLYGEKWFSVIFLSMFVVALILAVPLIRSTGLKKFPADEVTMTTVTYEEAEESSVHWD